MSDIPLDLQRRLEQRWAARFVSPVASGGVKRTGPSDEFRRGWAPLLETNPAPRCRTVLVDSQTRNHSWPE
jgi:hypothetical protein